MTELTLDNPPQTRPRRRRWPRRLFAAVVVVFLALAVWHFGFREKTLLDRSTRIASVNDSFQTSYRWLSDQELILGTFNEESRNWHVVGHNLRPDRGTVRKEWLYGTLSPDGQWVVYQDKKDWVLASIEGSRSLRWRVARTPAFSHYGLSDFSYVQWVGTGHRCAEIITDMDMSIHLEVHDPDTGKQETIHLAPLTTSESDVGECAVRGDYVFANSLTANAHTDIGNPHSPYDVDLYEWNLLKPSVPPRHLHIDAPKKYLIQDLQFAPRGDRIAWNVSFRHTSPMRVWLRKVFPSMPLVQYRQSQLWVSRVDGSEMQLIGAVEATLTKEEEELDDFEDDISSLAWLPDGNRLSFVCKKALYVVPVD